ncbi:hypothetical protein ACWEVY_28710 [Streptomyces longwoodensis]
MTNAHDRGDPPSPDDEAPIFDSGAVIFGGGGNTATVFNFAQCLIAGGTVAAAATVAKAKIEATTQRLKNEQDAETARLKIESDERVAGVQAAAQIESARQQASPPTAEVEGSTSG